MEPTRQPLPDRTPGESVGSARLPDTSRHSWTLPLSFACGLLALTGVALVVLYGVAPGLVASGAESLLGSDGSLSERARARLPELLHVAAASCVLWGLLGIAWLREAPSGRLRRLVLDDPLGSSPRRVLLGAATLGVAMLLLYDVNRRVDVGWLQTLFRKEGPLEQLTAVLYLFASGALVFAATRLLRSRSANRDGDPTSPWLPKKTALGVSICLWGQALAFFFVAGEEISWGQHLFDYATPAAYEEVNTQGEANVHNLLSKDHLDSGTRLAAVTAFAILVACWATLAATSSRALRVLLPHPSLLPLGYLTFLIAPWTHLEILEIMSGLFVGFYAWRLLRARLREEEPGEVADDVPALGHRAADPLPQPVSASHPGRRPRPAGASEPAPRR